MPIEPPDADPGADSRTATLARIAAAWIQYRHADPADCFECDMIIVAPDGSRVCGREACVASDRDFPDHTTINDVPAAPSRIDPLGNTANAVVPRQIIWQDDRTEHSDTGRDLVVLTRTGGSRRAALRTVLPAGGAGP